MGRIDVVYLHNITEGNDWLHFGKLIYDTGLSDRSERLDVKISPHETGKERDPSWNVELQVRHPQTGHRCKKSYNK